LDYPAELLEMIVVSDGSTDGTDALVSAFPCPRVRLIRQEPRQGKATALGVGFREAKFEMLVLTDANVVFAPDAIRQLMRHFADPQVGVVTGRVHLLDEKEGYAQAESAYYRYERFLQTSEA
ncbi:MAG TPA: glycosyltransferase, partial [Flavobacteriales bacterium]|nr:glycosyltransferase [Flavobacteriales bacterium]